MYEQDETLLAGGQKRRGSVLPWLLLLVVLGLAGYAYSTLHQPLLEEMSKKNAAILDLTRRYEEAKREAESAKEAKEALQLAEEQLKHARDDLARTSAQKDEDARLLAQLKSEMGTGGGEVDGAEGKITVTLVDKILFRSGHAELTPPGEALLRKLGGVLKGLDKLVEVCGHADNLPVESEVKATYPTNWELSTARATNVVRFLEEQAGIAPRRLKAAGFGSSRPVKSNATAAGRAKNRRIEILLLPDQMRVVKGHFPAEPDKAAPAPATPAKPTKPAPAKKRK